MKRCSEQRRRRACGTCGWTSRSGSCTRGSTPTSPPSSVSTPSPCGTACGWSARSPTRRGTSPSARWTDLRLRALVRPLGSTSARGATWSPRSSATLPPSAAGSSGTSPTTASASPGRLPTMRAGRRWPPRASARPSRRRRIIVGGFSRLDRSYIAAALHDPANPLVEQIDVANVHLRGPVNRMHGRRPQSAGVLPAHGILGAAVGHRDGVPVAAPPPGRPAADGRRARPGEVDHPRCAGHDPRRRRRRVHRLPRQPRVRTGQRVRVRGRGALA